MPSSNENTSSHCRTCKAASRMVHEALAERAPAGQLADGDGDAGEMMPLMVMVTLVMMLPV